MHVSALPPAARPVALKFPLSEVPHLTLEPTRACNLACRLCYTLDKGHVKDLATLREEIDLASRRRRLQAVTLVGGEPTLHDGILDIVAEVKRRGLVCQVLTNGLTLLSERGPALLRGLVGAGLDKIALHVDEGQGHRDLEAVRRRLFDRCEEARLPFSLSLTIYPESEAEIPEVARRYARYHYFDGILAVLGRDPGREEPHGPTLETQYRHISSRLGVEPTGYVPSSDDDGEAFWLVYFYFLRADTGRTFAVSPALHRAGRAVGRRLTGRHWLVTVLDPRRTLARFLALGALDVALAPRRVRPYLDMLRGPGLRDSLRSHYIAVQRPPEVDPRTGRLVLCFHCPDATVRDGRLTPVCLADFVRPFDGKRPLDEREARWGREVDAHLGEA